MSGVRNRRRKKRNRMGRRLVFTFGLLFCFVFIMRTVELYQKGSDYQKKIEKLQASYEDEMDRQSELQEQEKYMQTKRFVEEYAKEKLGLVYPNEIIFKANE